MNTLKSQEDYIITDISKAKSSILTIIIDLEKKKLENEEKKEVIKEKTKEEKKCMSCECLLKTRIASNNIKSTIPDLCDDCCIYSNLDYSNEPLLTCTLHF